MTLTGTSAPIVSLRKVGWTQVPATAAPTKPETASVLRRRDDVVTEPGMTHVVAECAPIGVQLWPTRSPQYAPNFTLAAIDVEGEQVTWTYESGSRRTFRKGESVTVRYC